MANVKIKDSSTPRDPGEPNAFEGGDLLGELLAEYNDVEVEKLQVKVPTRPGWVVEFDDQVRASDLRRYTVAATRGRGKNEYLDPTTLNGMLLLERNTAIYKETPDGDLQQVRDPEGDALTFRSIEFVTAYSPKDRPVDAILAVAKFLKDPVVVAIGGQVSEFAGWGESVEEWESNRADPTRG